MDKSSTPLSSQRDDPRPRGSEQPSTDWGALVQLLIGGFGILTLWGIASMFTSGAIISYLSSQTVLESTASLLAAAGSFFCGTLLIPPTWYAWLALTGKEVATKPLATSKLALFSILLFPFIIILGSQAKETPFTAIFLLPTLHILAISVPVLWFLTLGKRRLPPLTKRDGWGAFESGLVLAPFIIIIAEIGVFVLFIVLVLLYISQNADLWSAFLRITNQLSSATQSPEEIYRLLSPLLNNPWIIGFILLFGALVVPLLEELIKPIGVYLLAKRKLSPSEGFIAGLLSGAGYALFESLALSASAVVDWEVIVLARGGTSLIHIFNTGLMGWAIASMWTQKKGLRLLLAYAATVTIHALWNGAVIFLTLSTLPSQIAPTFNLPEHAMEIASFTLLALLIFVFTLLLLMNYFLRHAIIPHRR